MNESMKHVVASGGFDPLHIGHVLYLQEAKKLGDYLTVILNCDDWLLRKKGYAFMPEVERAEILLALRCVDSVFLLHSDRDDVLDGLKVLHPDIFAKGGDRTDSSNIPEWGYCKDNNIEVVTGVGGGKIQASSILVENAKKHLTN